MTETIDQHRPTAAQWQEPEHLRWSFQHMDELFPSATIGAAGPAAELPGIRGTSGPLRCRCPAASA